MGTRSNFVNPCVQVWKFWVSGVCTVVTGGLGTAGNILSLIVLCKRYNSQQVEASRQRKKRKEARMEERS